MSTQREATNPTGQRWRNWQCTTRRGKEEKSVTVKHGPVQNQADQLPLKLIRRTQMPPKLLVVGAWESDDWAVASEPQRSDASDTPLRAYPMSDRVPREGMGLTSCLLMVFPFKTGCCPCPQGHSLESASC